jgi:hypothetical protein
MKKVLLILFLLSNNAFGQSKEDTQIWIKSTIENFARRDVYPLLNVYFNDGDIWFVELEDGGTYQRELPLNKINQVIIKSDAKGYVLTLGCSADNACCKTVRYKILGNGSLEKINSNEPNRYGVNIYLQKSMGEDNMIARLKKAMSHLIDLNGGKVKSDTF